MEVSIMKSKLSIGFSLILIGIFLSQAIYSQVVGLVKEKHAEQVISVGGPDADIQGFTSIAIQIALDAVKSRGGGTVKLNPGVYNITGPLRLTDNTSLIGSGQSTVLKKCDGFKTRFTVDADWGMLKAVVEDPSGFKKGCLLYTSPSPRDGLLSRMP